MPSAWKRPIPSVAGKTNFNRPSPTNTPPAMSRIRIVAGGAASAGGVKNHWISLCIVWIGLFIVLCMVYLLS